jgi:heme A synthase
VTAAPANYTSETRADREPLYASLIGLTSLAVLLQGLWAGLFVREGKDFDATSAQSNWVQVHDWGARVAIVLAFASLVVAGWRLRSRKELILGTGALFVLLLVEAYIGGKIGDHASWPSIHIPMAMALMALSVWLPMRAVRGARMPSRPEPPSRRDGSDPRSSATSARTPSRTH